MEPGSGHHFNARCCNNEDCREIDSSQVRLTKDGYLYLPTGQVIPLSEEDHMVTPFDLGDRWYACFLPSGRIRQLVASPMPGTESPDDGKYCLYVPSPSG